MNSDTDDPKADDVYSERTYVRSTSDNDFMEQCSIRITADNSPMSLSRVYGLLATLMMVPVAARSTVTSVDELAVELGFRNVPVSSIDRLCRKLAQTTEIATVSALHVGDGRPVFKN